MKSFVLRSFERNDTILKFHPKQRWNIKEITSLYHFPHSRFNKSPRIKWQMYKIVPAPDNIPTEGVLL
ncbi:MAG: hypothetical protein WCJ81_03720 [bacterium]